MHYLQALGVCQALIKNYYFFGNKNVCDSIKKILNIIPLGPIGDCVSGNYGQESTFKLPLIFGDEYSHLTVGGITLSIR